MEKKHYRNISVRLKRITFIIRTRRQFEIFGSVKAWVSCLLNLWSLLVTWSSFDGHDYQHSSKRNVFCPLGPVDPTTDNYLKRLSQHQCFKSDPNDLFALLYTMHCRKACEFRTSKITWRGEFFKAFEETAGNPNELGSTHVYWCVRRLSWPVREGTRG